MNIRLLLFFCVIPFIIFCDGGLVTSNRYNDSLIGSFASPGPSGTFSAAYGQLTFNTSHPITILQAHTWVAVPFDDFTPSHQVTGSTTPPATITIQEAGAYQVNVSLYFSVEQSDEGTFTQTTYTLGQSINGAPQTPCGSVYAGESGQFSLNYSALETFAAEDYIQFYIEASTVPGGGNIFDNIITISNSNAYVMQIAQ